MGRSSRFSWIGVLAIVMGSACSEKAPSRGECTASSQCQGGEVCYASKCRQVCAETEHCAGGMICVDGLCIPSSEVPPGDTPPEITSINGTGWPDGQPGHTANRMIDRLLVTGRYLTGATAALVGPQPSTASTTLTACAAGSDTEMSLGLPSSLTAGEYALTVVNQGGQACTGVSILKGEDGSILNADQYYVNVDGDAMTGDLSIAGQLGVWTQSSAASLSARSTVSEPLSGQVTATGADATVTGVGTAFTTELLVGDAVMIQGTVYSVTAIGSATSMTVSPQPAAFLNVAAYRGAAVLELQDGTGAARVTVDRLGRVGVGTAAPAQALDVSGNLRVTGTVNCTGCVDGTDLADGTITDADIAAAASIAASKINRAGLDADSVDGRQPTVLLRSCVTSCSVGGWSSQCPCVSTGSVSTSATITCTGNRYWDSSSSQCYNYASSTCPCSTSLGYLLNP